MELKNRYTRVQFAIVLGAIYIVWATIVTSQAWKHEATHPVLRTVVPCIFIALTIHAVQLRLRDAVSGAAVRRGVTLVVMSVVAAHVLLAITTVLPLSILNVIAIPLGTFFHLLYFSFPLNICCALILCLILPSAVPLQNPSSPRRAAIEPPKVKTEL